MAFADLIVAGGVVGAFVLFAAALAWVTRDYKRYRLHRDVTGGE